MYKYGVDMYLYGHVHNYQRLFPVYNSIGAYVCVSVCVCVCVCLCADVYVLALLSHVYIPFSLSYHITYNPTNNAFLFPSHTHTHTYTPAVDPQGYDNPMATTMVLVGGSGNDEMDPEARRKMLQQVGVYSV